MILSLIGISGTLITVNFFQVDFGRKVQVAVDSAYVSELDLYTAGVVSSDCLVTPWTSDALTLGQHTLKVTALDLNTAITDGQGYVDIHDFVYVYNVVFQS
jgi:hypothetical protein